MISVIIQKEQGETEQNQTKSKVSLYCKENLQKQTIKQKTYT